MKFSDKVKYKYVQHNYGKKHTKKQQSDFIRIIDGLEDYLEKKIGKYTNKKK
ncbi:MAG: hypothetical protein N4A63_16005 [Vallitalea sp.]|jgi:hypothetical protein|nr:hypothetical protein [Vallitalea sp.]